MKIISWNVNGLRAVEKKGFLPWLYKESPDLIGLQEIKAQEDQLSEEIKNPLGYKGFFNPAERKGYSGTAFYTKTPNSNLNLLATENGFGFSHFDCEGRVQQADFGDFIFFNIYFPNGKRSPERLQYKLDFYDRILDHFENLVSDGKKLIIAGDYNTAHNEIDLARPKDNENVSGFLRIERDWLDKLVDRGYVDCFRKFNSDPGHYTWWSFRSGARPRNVGWRIDYFFCSKNLLDQIEDCYHLDKIEGSDHCPIVLKLKN